MRPTVENRPRDFSMHRFDQMAFPDHLHAQIEILIPLQGNQCARVDGRDVTVYENQEMCIRDRSIPPAYASS